MDVIFERAGFDTEFLERIDTHRGKMYLHFVLRKTE
jgi:hypothetical protein